MDGGLGLRMGALCADLGPGMRTVLAIAVIAIVTLLNLSGTRLLARVAMFGFVCELIGAVVVGGYLFLFARHQPLVTVLQTHGILLNGSYWRAFAAAPLAGMFFY